MNMIPSKSDRMEPPTHALFWVSISFRYMKRAHLQ